MPSILKTDHKDTIFASDLREWIIKIPHRIAVDRLFAEGITIPHELKAIIGPVRDIVIFPAHILHQLEEMQPTARIDRGHRTMGLAILEPASTCGGPYKPLHELMCMVVIVADRASFGFEGLDVLCLHLLDHLEGVAGVPFEDWQDRAVTCGSIWTDEYWND
jgi:hypothetical protein